MLVNENTTWHAYNRWGGTSLYRGPTGFADRAYAVSLDRPIDYGMGTGDYWGNEAPLGRLAEKLGLPVVYVTDTDLHTDPHLLDGARAVISLGHDEYYSQAMWTAGSRGDKGTNLAFLGANAMYRHIRLGPTPIGPDRLETDYKDAGLDPVSVTNPAEATSQWRQPPVPRPESVVTGVFYQCNPVKADMVVAQPDSWLFAGTGVKAGDKLASLVGSEYDQVTPSVPTPRPIEVLFHSPVTCTGHRQFADAAYYTTPSGAGVFAPAALVDLRSAPRVHLPRARPTSRRHRDDHDHDPASSVRRRPRRARPPGPRQPRAAEHHHHDHPRYDSVATRPTTPTPRPQ